MRLPDECLFRVGRPSEAHGAQLCEVCVTSGIGSRNRSATNQAWPGSEVRAFDSLPFFFVSKATSSVRVESSTNMKNSESSERRLINSECVEERVECDEPPRDGRSTGRSRATRSASVSSRNILFYNGIPKSSRQISCRRTILVSPVSEDGSDQLFGAGGLHARAHPRRRGASRRCRSTPSTWAACRSRLRLPGLALVTGKCQTPP